MKSVGRCDCGIINRPVWRHLTAPWLKFPHQPSTEIRPIFINCCRFQ